LSAASRQVEGTCIDILRAVKSQVAIPGAVKLSPVFSTMAGMARRLDEAEAHDVIGTLARQASAHDLDVVVVTRRTR
jgi:dihydroorotate dehydrogenase (fumarate)